MYEPKEREEVIDRVADMFGFDEKKGDVEMTITKKCRICRKEFKINVKKADYDAWKNGEKLIQQAFPYLTDNEREVLISGICSPCFDELLSLGEE
jgi:hypothetical protein